MAEEEKIIKPERNEKMEFHVLASVCVGIAAVFFLMPFINTLIFMITSEQKAAYYLSIIASNTLFLLLILVIKAGNHFTWADLGWKKAEFGPAFKDTLKIWAIIWLLNMVYTIIISFNGVIPTESEPLAKLLEKPSYLTLAWNILLIAGVAALIEETLFRGLLFGSMRTYFGTWSAIVLSAAAFSALHLELLGFFPRFALGVGLGYLYVKHDSIFPSIALHALNNLLVVLLISTFS